VLTRGAAEARREGGIHLCKVPHVLKVCGSSK
jgi:hypothetical protein